MSHLSYIDSYFKKELSPEEIKKFEQQIADDPEFADEVAFYCTAMTAVKDQHREERKKQFRKIYEENDPGPRLRTGFLKKWWPYISAAAVIAAVILGWYIFTAPTSPRQLADQYIKEHFETQMGMKMSGTEDSLNTATRLYNENKLPESLKLFEAISTPGSHEYLTAERMAGIVSLRLGEYDKALDYFARMESRSLQYNPGKFYRALTLIKRNLPGDKPLAKKLLQEVVQQGLEEKETASKWLKSL